MELNITIDLDGTELEAELQNDDDFKLPDTSNMTEQDYIALDNQGGNTWLYRENDKREDPDTAEEALDAVIAAIHAKPSPAFPVSWDEPWRPVPGVDSVQCVTNLLRPWDNQPMPVADSYTDLVYFTLTDEGHVKMNMVNKNFKLSDLLKNSRTSKRYDEATNTVTVVGPLSLAGHAIGGIVAALPGDYKMYQRIGKQLADYSTTPERKIHHDEFKDCPEVREYLEDLELLYPEINEELCLRWTPELVAHMDEPLSFWNKELLLIVRFGGEVAVIPAGISRYSIEYMRGEMYTYCLKQPNATPELLAVVQAMRGSRTHWNLNEALGNDNYDERLPDGRRREPAHPFSTTVGFATDRINKANNLVNSEWVQQWFAYLVEQGAFETLVPGTPERTCVIVECGEERDPYNDKRHCRGHRDQAREVERQAGWSKQTQEGLGRERAHMYLVMPESMRKEVKHPEGYSTYLLPTCVADYVINDQELLCDRQADSLDGLCHKHKLDQLNGFEFAPVRGQETHRVKATGESIQLLTPKKLCAFEGCEREYREGFNHNEMMYCVKHVGQHETVEKQRSSTRAVKPRFVEHMYLVYSDDDLEDRLCVAEYEIDGKQYLCASSAQSADDLCHCHKREQLNGFELSWNPMARGKRDVHRDKATGERVTVLPAE